MIRATDATIPAAHRLPTPSHDAAHVLVSFQQNGMLSDVHESGSTSSGKRRLHAHRGNGRSSRPLSVANVSRPPQNRRRVWRACEACRKKKTKCDGAEPCECCLDAGSECVYAVEGYRRGFVDSQVVEVYGKRIQALEDLVATLVEDQQKLSAQISNAQFADKSGDRLPAVDPGLNQPQTEPQPSSLPQPTVDLESLNRPSQASDVAILPEGSVTVETIGDKGEELAAPRLFTDDYGIMTSDEIGGARYAGLGATVTMVGECSGIQNRIRQGLAQKGHGSPESILNRYYVLGKSCPTTPVMDQYGQTLPPVPLMDTLIDAFFLKVYRLFPIIEADDFQRQYLAVLSGKRPRPGFLALLYSILAVSSPHISSKDPIWARKGCSPYRDIDLGEHFYGLAIAAGGATDPFLMAASPQRNNINTITSLTLLGMHLAQLGMLGEAWNTIGQAVRLGYEIGLHRSPKRMGLPLLDVKRRCQLWWCLYVMDRLISLHVGRPLAINDNDSDVLFPSARPQAPGFVAMTHLCRLVGRIYTTVSSIQGARKWKDAANYLELQSQVQDLWSDLQSWRNQMLPTTEADRKTERYVLLSSYISAVHLLLRQFMPTPHRSFALRSPNPLKECANAAIECIEISQDLIRNLPLSHYYILHGQNLFVSVVILLHCMRQTNDDQLVSYATLNSQRGIAILSTLESSWPMARQYGLIAEEYQALTKQTVDSGKYNQCLLDASNETELGVSSAPPDAFEPWREFAASIDLDSTNLFPSIPDAGWMNELFLLSPSSSGALDLVDPVPGLESVPAIAPDPNPAPAAETKEGEVNSEPALKRRKVIKRGTNPVCAFSMKRSRPP